MASHKFDRIQTKDLISVGVFTALYFVIFFACGMLGYIPIFLVLLPLICPLVSGIPFMLYLTKVRTFGMVTITGFICGVLMFVTGMSWQPIISALVFAFLADLILRTGNYRNGKRTILAYGVFSLWVMGMMFPLFFNRNSYWAGMRSSYGEEYISSVTALTPTWAFFALCVLAFLGGILGGILGRKVLRKHFVRAGIA